MAVRTANGILFSPEGTIQRVERKNERQGRIRDEADAQTGLESQVALAPIEQVSEDVRDKVDMFEEREELLPERFAETAN